MPLPSRFESYKGFVIHPFSAEFDDGSGSKAQKRWTIGGSFHPENDPSAEEPFRDRTRLAPSHDEAIDLALEYGKRLIDARVRRAP
jgi:hypothetical protein